MITVNKKKKVILSIIAIIVLVILLVYIFLPELRLMTILKYSPEMFRNKYFYKLEKGDQQLYLLGTTHRHYMTEDYSEQHLAAVIENLKPDLLLVESRPEELQVGNIADGPEEMLFSHLIARELNIDVKGVDWWIPGYSKPGTTTAERDEHIVANILETIKGKQKVLILLGGSHVIFNLPELEDEGYKIVKFPIEEKKRLFTINNRKPRFPDGMEYYLQRKIDRQKELIGEVYTGEWVEIINNSNKNLQRMVDYIKGTRKQ